MKLPELPAVLKLQVVLKTLAVQACLLVGVLLVAWGLQRAYSFVDRTTFPQAMNVPAAAADLPDTAMSTICAGVMGVVGLMMVHQTAKPYNKLRIAMICVLALGFAGSFLFLKALFNLVALDFLSALVLAVFALLAWPVMNVMYKLLDKLSAFVQRRKKTCRAAKEL